MNRLEKFAGYGLFGIVAIITGLNLILALGGRIQGWSLPLLYLVFIAGMFVWRRHEGFRIKFSQIVLVLLVPLALWGVSLGMNHFYDTSWDGQDYQQSGVIALANGWNPWHNDNLPINLPGAGEYVRGYPKSIWLLQASIYKLTGHLQMAPVTNVVFGLLALILVFAALRRVGVSKGWSWIISVLAIFEVHFMQQATTFMADGYSYQLSLIAIAGFVLLVYDAGKKWPLAIVLASLLLLAGGKFSNMFVCALLGLAVLVYLYRQQAYKMPDMRTLLMGFMVIAAVFLWVPFGTNIVRYHSPIYPQNQTSEGDKLRFDNVPNNLKSANRFELLFYGIYSATEPSNAGNPTSPYNVAQLKAPFTFHKYEIRETNNFQGRVGSGGILFSGIFTLAMLCLAILWLAKVPTAGRQQLARISVVIGLIIAAALIIPVPNKLRYSPLITLIPLLVTVALVSIRGKQRKWARPLAILLVIVVACNTIVAAGALVQGRTKDSRAVRSQIMRFNNSGHRYQVFVGSFYSNYTRLQDAGVPVDRVTSLSCHKPIKLEASYGTTLLCKEQ